jgi:lysophospholipase L1-like esterase
MKIKQFQNILLGLLILYCSQEIQSQPLSILPLGNSLTKGVYCNNGHIIDCENRPDSQVTGYRYQLFNELIASGYVFDFVGNELAGWMIFPTVYLARHAGYPSITSAQLATKLNDNNNYLLTSTAPDIILLEIGTNDIYGASVSIEGVRSILNEINEFETASGKPVLVFLSKVIKFTQGMNTPNENLVATFNSNLWALYNQRKSSGDLIEWVDVGANLVNLLQPAGDMTDELHPNQDGYDKMAEQWFQAIDNYNTTPVPAQIPDQYTTEGNNFSAISLDTFIDDVEDADAQITWTVQPEPQYLTVTINGSRQAVISPNNSNWYGSETITFIATDRGRTVPGLQKSVSITVACTVEPVNDPPVILSQTRVPSTIEETPVAISITDLQVQDIDNPQGDLTLQVLSGSNYSFSGNTITPGLEFNGELNVNIRINDLQSSSQVFSFTINVSAKNDIPVIISANSLSFNEDSPFQLKLSDFQVSDPDNYYPADFILITGDGLHYTHSGNTITPALNYNGNLQVPVRVRDLLDLSNEFILTITILPVNDPPFINIPANRSAYEGDYFEFQLEADDIDQTDPLQLSSITLPNWLTFNSVNKKLQGTPANQNIGDNIVKMRVNDTHVSVDSTFIIIVQVKSGLTSENEMKGNYSVYPNPASCFINILRNDGKNQHAVFKLYNITGHLVFSEVISNKYLLLLNQYTLKPGFYFFEIADGVVSPYKGKLLIVNADVSH